LLYLGAGGFGQLDGHADDGDPTLPQGAAGSRSADHAEVIPFQLYSA